MGQDQSLDEEHTQAYNGLYIPQNDLELLSHVFSVGIIGFFTAFGMLLSKMGEKGKIMVDFFSILNYIIMEMVNIIMW